RSFPGRRRLCGAVVGARHHHASCALHPATGMTVAMQRALRLGVTGGIGSGKSTFAAMLQACGAAWVDADRLARAVTESGGSAIDAIRAQFGADFIDARGAMD